MLIRGLYRLDESYSPRLAAMLSECFMSDPLFVRMIPDEAVRQKMLPLYFTSYFENFFPYCHVYADGPELGGVVVVYDETDAYSYPKYLFAAARSGFETVAAAIHEDPTFKTAIMYLRSVRYLKSTWVSRMVKRADRHIDFLGVRESARGQGIAGRLVRAVEAGEGGATTLETHNPQNVDLYSHLGYETVLKMSGRGLNQYCMVKR